MKLDIQVFRTIKAALRSLSESPIPGNSNQTLKVFRDAHEEAQAAAARLGMLRQAGLTIVRFSNGVEGVGFIRQYMNTLPVAILTIAGEVVPAPELQVYPLYLAVSPVPILEISIMDYVDAHQAYSFHTYRRDDPPSAEEMKFQLVHSSDPSSKVNEDDPESSIRTQKIRI